MTRHEQVLAGRYELGPLLGVGGMASVYQATDRALERTVAVKVLDPPSDQDPALVERFRHEARAAASLSHPNIVTVFDSGSEAGVHYLVMEYVQGETLADTLRRQGVLEPCWAAEVGRCVCGALGAAHARGLVHRDVKPANVLISPAGMVKVTDFGIASAAATPSFIGGRILLGTAAYLSPEQAQGGPVDARSDLYALGCVLYELLTGTPPSVADSPPGVAGRRAQAATPPSRRNPQVGPELEAVVMTALAKEPARRYQTAWAMGQDLERVVAGGAAGAVGLWPAAAGPATQALGSPAASSGSTPTVVIPTRAARQASRSLTRAAARRPGRTGRSLATGLGLVVLLVVALGWLRGGGSATVERQAGPAATAATATSASTSTTTPQGSQPSVPGDVGHAERGGHGRAVGHDRSGHRSPAAPGRGCHARCP
jgi:hypothetical protein